MAHPEEDLKSLELQAILPDVVALAILKSLSFVVMPYAFVN